MPKIAGNIALYMGPKGMGGEDDLEKTIVDFIDEAQKTLFIAVQELDCRKIAEAIIRAKQRKVLVKLVLEGDYLISTLVRPDPFQAGAFATGGPTRINGFYPYPCNTPAPSRSLD